MDMKEIKPLSAALATPLDEPIGPPLTSDHTESRLVRSPVQTVNQPVETGFLTQNEVITKDEINHVGASGGSDQWVSQNSGYQEQEISHQISSHSGHPVSSHQNYIQPIQDNDVVMKQSHPPNDLIGHSPQVVNSNNMSQVVKNEPIVTQSTVLTGEQIKMALKNGCRIIDSNGVEVNLGTVGFRNPLFRNLAMLNLISQVCLKF